MRPLVVLPTYNEALNIEEVIEKVRAAVPHAQILVVDDGSPDGTADLAEELGRELGNVSVLRRAAKSGLGSAYRAGFREGLARELDVMIEMDSDLSHDPAALPSLLAAIDEGADLVIGSRYVPGGTIPNWGLHRRLLSRWGNRYAGFVLGLPVRDSTAGYRAYRATALAEGRPRRDPGRRLRLPDRDGLRRAAQRRPHRRGADLVQRPRARHVEDVEPHRGRGARPRHVVGDPRSAAASRQARYWRLMSVTAPFVAVTRAFGSTGNTSFHVPAAAHTSS